MDKIYYEFEIVVAMPKPMKYTFIWCVEFYSFIGSSTVRVFLFLQLCELETIFPLFLLKYAWKYVSRYEFEFERVYMLLR